MKNTQTLLNRQNAKSRLVFIDPTVENYQSLVHGVLADTEVFILDTDRDGVVQISEILAGRIGLASLHIVSHGAPGRVYLGNTELGQHTLNNYTHQLINWTEAFSSDAQILLYGCDVAQAESGKAFVHRLSELTGTTVLASDDKTGSAQLGGDWELEVTTKSSNVALAFESATLEAYSAVLAKPYLVKDIKSGSSSSSLTRLIDVNGILYFVADDGIHGYELWQSDGTANGTVLVKDTNTNNGVNNLSGTSDYLGPYNLANINGILYFLADDGNGYGLWKSNGTGVGTVPVERLGYYLGFAAPISSLTNVGDTLYFSIKLDRSDLKLWKSDGTPEGTVIVKAIDSFLTDLDSFVNVNGTLYFRNYFYDSGSSQLWKSDGTEAGTVLIKGFYSESYPSNYLNFNLTNVNGTLFFTVNDGTQGTELWKSDGTTAGTVLVQDINPGSASSNPTNLTDINGTLYFTVKDGTQGAELWKSDGTAAGTVLVKDINPGSRNSNPNHLTNINGILYFAANDGINGAELWKSDGTAAGTVLVKDINPGSRNSNVSNLTNINGTLYFAANDGIHGTELWKSDGTTAGTVLVQDINPGSDNSSPSKLTYANGTLYFSADDGINGSELWALNIITIPPVVSPIISITATDANAAEADNDSAVFRISRTGDTNTALTVKYNVDGTAINDSDYNQLNGTITIAAGQSFVDISITPVDDILREGSETVTLTLFTQPDYAIDSSLVTATAIIADNTSTAVVPRPYLVKDIRPGNNNDYYNNYIVPSRLTNINGTLYFTADDGTHGNELWKSNGTAAGTVLVKDINPGSSSGFGDFDSGSLTNINGVLYLRTDLRTDNGYYQLWRSDGTADGTVVIPASGGYLSVRYWDFTPININGIFYFQAYDQTYGYELWKTDGTVAGTVLVKDIIPGAGSSNPVSLIKVNDILYFITGGTNYELWKSDGTTVGTVKVKDIKSQASFNSASLTNVNDILYLIADDATGIAGVTELWRSDGTATGTFLVKDIKSGSGSVNSPNPTIINNILYFFADDGTNGRELWRSDGTTAGTVLVKDINLGSDGSNPSNPTIINNTLYFFANDRIHGTELWKSDGTAAGTVLVKDINPEPVDYYDALSVINVNGILYFTADDGTHGIELWRSDGTAVGTFLVKDINPSSESNISYPNYPLNLTNVNGTLYFSADDGIHGRELWRSDGTAAGTVMVEDINSGVNGSTFLGSNNTSYSDGILYFTANDGIHGYELWALNTNPTAINSTVTISAIDTNAVETDNSPASFRISRTGDISTALAVKYTIEGTATNGSDYTQLTGIASIAVGQSFADITITPVDDGLVEGSETVTLTLTIGTDYDINTSYTSATVAIAGSINIINGGNNRDPLTGTDGSDRIVGGTGRKTITGGDGNDEFVYTSIREVGHRITDFTVGSDKIVLTELLDSLVSGDYNGSNAITDGYVQLVQGSTTNSSILQIDRDGLMGSAVFRPFIQLDNVTPQVMNNTSNFVF